MAICIVLLIGTISIPGILGQSDEINNNNNNNNKDMEHNQKYLSSNIVEQYFNNNTLVHQKDFVNNVTLHYVIGGKETQFYFYMDGQKLGMNGDTLFPN